MAEKLSRVTWPIAKSDRVVVDFVILPDSNGDMFKEIKAKHGEVSYKPAYLAMINVEFKHYLTKTDPYDFTAYQLNIKHEDQCAVLNAMKRFLPENFDRSKFFYKDECNNLTHYKIEEHDISRFAFSRKAGTQHYSLVPTVGYDKAGNPMEGIAFTNEDKGTTSFISYDEFLFLYTTIAIIKIPQYALGVITLECQLLYGEKKNYNARPHNIPPDVFNTALEIDRRIAERG